MVRLERGYVLGLVLLALGVALLVVSSVPWVKVKPLISDLYTVEPRSYLVLKTGIPESFYGMYMYQDVVVRGSLTVVEGGDIKLYTTQELHSPYEGVDYYFANVSRYEPPVSEYSFEESVYGGSYYIVLDNTYSDVEKTVQLDVDLVRKTYLGLDPVGWMLSIVGTVILVAGLIVQWIRQKPPMQPAST